MSKYVLQRIFVRLLREPLMGLQEMENGMRRRPGVVTLRTAPDMAHRCLDLRTTNLLVTTRGG